MRGLHKLSGYKFPATLRMDMAIFFVEALKSKERIGHGGAEDGRRAPPAQSGSAVLRAKTFGEPTLIWLALPLVL
jgi:hypothetical protein